MEPEVESLDVAMDHPGMARLTSILSDLGSVVVAYSGGIDSSLLLKVARNVLGRQRVVGVTAVSPSYPSGELLAAQGLAREIGADHILLNSKEMDDPRYRQNDGQRCYFCKEELFRLLRSVRDRKGFQSMAYGANLDDASDIRPGMRAAAEVGVRAPLLEAEMGKEEIRKLAKLLGLPNWNKPARACLSSRIPVGTSIRQEDLRRVERAEDFLLDRGFAQVRVRSHGPVARIETDPEGMRRLGNPDLRREIAGALRQLGFRFVTLDLEGYRQGSLNPLSPPDRQDP